MAQNLSRRKYSKLVKVFTEIMQDKKQSIRTRMVAAGRLGDILMAADARAEKLADRKHRAELRALGQVVPEPAEVSEPEPEPNDIQTVLDSVLSRKDADAC